MAKPEVLIDEEKFLLSSTEGTIRWFSLVGETWNCTKAGPHEYCSTRIRVPFSVNERT